MPSAKYIGRCLLPAQEAVASKSHKYPIIGTWAYQFDCHVKKWIEKWDFMPILNSFYKTFPCAKIIQSYDYCMTFICEAVSKHYTRH